MSVVAEFTIPAEALPFGDTLVATPDAEIEVERIVPTQESALPFFWILGCDPEVFIEDAETEQDISHVQLLARVENGALFQAQWAPNAKLIRGIKRLDATIIEATGTSEHWRFEVRTQEQDTFNDFQEIFEEQGIPIELKRIYDLTELVESNLQSLTSEQRETLIAAYQEGYYEKPRQTTQEELGEEFDISHRAVSARLRRGTRNLIRESLLPPEK
ncbi:helix-turn-helix domain-containing protein [Natrinema amylolyticum]|uniref:helix-turn-helix domain-containing protein n=1 Tax=Natrinema amylolyticum TaxID=2878679 RepID=UPI001CFC1179|nr:helix-turn-helix domain-containing protein [Natrinema amylolyticum]